MNLLRDQWFPVIRKNGTEEKIAVCQLLDRYHDNPVMAFKTPRPDLRNALYQLLIGIVHVSAMPEDEEDWEDFFKNPYSAEEFSERLLTYADCFEINSEGPAFMQDYDLKDAKENPIFALFIGAPGENTIKENRDHFIKRRTIEKIDPYWAAISLYTLQTFAPSGGSGHRTSLRGGGPLTTILIPSQSSTLWQKIWLNVISKEETASIPGNFLLNKKENIFPWMKETKSNHKEESELYPKEVHPLHHFFGMPRRIRLIFSNQKGICDLTGEKCECLVSSFIAKNYGNNYKGVWRHPLNAYSYNNEPSLLSIKAQPGGVDYRHWLGLAVRSDKITPAEIIRLTRESEDRKSIIEKYGLSIWAAGFDMDNMKSRCWYESTMPVYPLSTKDAEIVSNFVQILIEEANKLSKNLRSAVKSAWFSSPKEVKGDMRFLDTAFWQNTESDFYSILDEKIGGLKDNALSVRLIDDWGNVLKTEAENLFNESALAQQEDGIDMKRVISARNKLEKKIGRMRNSLKNYRQQFIS